MNVASCRIVDRAGPRSTERLFLAQQARMALDQAAAV
jgi:hypothetical protein